MSWGKIKQTDFWGIALAYSKKKYGNKVTIDVTITTKKDKKAVYNSYGYQARYTMFVIDGDETIAKSKELPGYNKGSWSPEELVEFITSLDYV